MPRSSAAVGCAVATFDCRMLFEIVQETLYSGGFPDKVRTKYENLY